jgi:hypothetical protein
MIKPANILSVILICLCIYGGSGFYLGQYCCKDCRDVGIEAALSDKCHKIHNTEEHTCCSKQNKDDQNKQSDDCSPVHYDHEKCCSVTSYKLDVVSGIYKAQINIPVLDLPYPLLHHILNKEVFSLSLSNNLKKYILPKYSPGDIPILHSSLLI